MAPLPSPIRHNAFHQRLRFAAPELDGDHYADECALEHPVPRSTTTEGGWRSHSDATAGRDDTERGL